MIRILRHAGTVVLLTLRRSLRVRTSRMAASLAFYSLFSLSPLLMVAIAVGAVFFGEKVARAATSESIREWMGDQQADTVMTLVSNATRLNERITVTAVGLAVAVWAATRVFVELRKSMNDIWGIDRPDTGPVRAVLTTRLVSFSMVLATGLALLASTAATTVLQALRRQMGTAHPVVDEAFSRFAYPLASYAMIVLLFALVYKLLPACKVAWSDVWPGAILSAGLFTLGKYLIGMYLSRTTLVSVYGATGSLVVLLMWIYYSAQIFLLGAVFSSVYAERVGSRRHHHATS
jgi:membrane protein